MGAWPLETPQNVGFPSGFLYSNGTASRWPWGGSHCDLQRPLPLYPASPSGVGLGLGNILLPVELFSLWSNGRGACLYFWFHTSIIGFKNLMINMAWQVKEEGHSQLWELGYHTADCLNGPWPCFCQATSPTSRNNLRISMVQRS